VVGTDASVLARRSAELGHRADDDVVPQVPQISRERLHALREHREELAEGTGLIRVRVPSVEIDSDNLHGRTLNELFANSTGSLIFARRFSSARISRASSSASIANPPSFGSASCTTIARLFCPGTRRF